MTDLRAPLVAVCSEIGRGHPGYLDSVLLALSRLAKTGTVPPGGLSPFSPNCLKVPKLCTGTSGLAWKAVRVGYRFGGLGGPATWLYNRLRSPDARPSSLQLSLLGSSLRRDFAGYKGICLIDHPLLAHILSGTCRVAYVHGEIAAPGMSAVPHAWRTFVPLESTARKLVACGLKPEAVCTTGLLIEPQLVAQAEAAYTARLQRLSPLDISNRNCEERSTSLDIPLTVGFFTSGAHPRPHRNRILLAAASAARAGHRAFIFWGLGWLRAARAQLLLRRFALPENAVRPVWARTRQDETTRTAELFPQLDVMVAAAHERTNWTIGLGLPMFALLPHIGPFAAGNSAFAHNQGTCLPLESPQHAHQLGEALTALHRSGRLAEMSRAGWGRYPITGAATAARILTQAHASRG